MQSSYSRPRLLAPLLLLCASLLTWVLWYPPSPDLAALTFRVHLFSSDGFSLWDNNWYGGHYLPSYSLIFPPMAALLGVRVTGALAVASSTALFWQIVRGHRSLRVPLATMLFVLGATGDLFIGRVAFAVGISFALASVFSVMRGQRLWCAVFSLACAATSPVAAAFLVLVAFADLLANRTPARAAVLALPAISLTSMILLLFPEAGYEPFALTSLLAAAGASITVLLLVPPDERMVRYTAALYLLALLLAYFLRTPMGSNAVRFGILFAPAALVGHVSLDDVRRVLTHARLTRGPVCRPARCHPISGSRRIPASILALASTALVLWQLNGPVAQSVQASLSPSSSYRFYLPAIRYLEGRTRRKPTRIEEVFTSSHWDATILGQHFLLARGWDRQLDTRYNPLFYEGHLSAFAYHSWLLENGVQFVLLPNAPLDFSSVQEAFLLRNGLKFLRLVMHTTSWHIYEVRGARSLTTGPGYLTGVDGDGFSIRVIHAGRLVVRIHYTPYWQVTSGSAAITSTKSGWTQIAAPRRGELAMDAEFSLGRIA